MQTWPITLQGPSGIIRTVDADESQFVISTETAIDVFTVHGEGVMPRHAWVWISEAGLQVEDLGGGTPARARVAETELKANSCHEVGHANVWGGLGTGNPLSPGTPARLFFFSSRSQVA